MADDINDRYKKAANIRLLSMMAGAAPKPQPNTPNYSAIPLNPTAPAGRRVMPYEITLFNGPHSLANEPWWVPEGEPLTNGSPNPPPMPPAMNLGPLPPMNADAQQADDAARYRPMPQQASKPAAMPSMPPVNVQAPAPTMDPRTAGDADMGGYGGSPRVFSQNEMYGHLNPTPSLEEIFRREYAANPGAFGKIG